MVKKPYFYNKVNHWKGLREVTSRGGLVLAMQLAEYLGLRDTISRHSSRRRKESKYSNFHYIWSFVLGLLSGCDCIQDYLVMQWDKGLKRMFKGWQFPGVSSLTKYISGSNLGHVKQLEKVNREALKQARVRRSEHIVLDIDGSMVRGSSGKEGSRQNYTRRSGFQILVGFVYDTSELIRVKLLKGNDSVHGVVIEFLEQSRRSLRYEAHQIIVRMDAGFYSNKLMDHLEAKGYRYVVCGHRSTFFWRHLKTVPEKIWSRYREGRQCCQIWWEIVLSSKKKRQRKFILMRKEIGRGKNLHLFEGRYDYSLFATNLSLRPKRLLDFYFQRGNVENYIKELKHGIGMTKLPCKRFNANAARLQIMQLAYNCHRWIQLLGFQKEKEKLSIKTMRMRFFNTAASLIRPQGRPTIVWSQNQPYLSTLLDGLDNLKLAA